MAGGQLSVTTTIRREAPTCSNRPGDASLRAKTPREAGPCNRGRCCYAGRAMSDGPRMTTEGPRRAHATLRRRPCEDAAQRIFRPGFALPWRQWFYAVPAGEKQIPRRFAPQDDNERQRQQQRREATATATAKATAIARGNGKGNSNSQREQQRLERRQRPEAVSGLRAQNSRRDSKAIMRGELSPPRPTPSRPVGGDVVEVRAPKPVCVAGFPGIPAKTMLGSAKLG